MLFFPKFHPIDLVNGYVNMILISKLYKEPMSRIETSLLTKVFYYLYNNGTFTNDNPPLLPNNAGLSDDKVIAKVFDLMLQSYVK